MRQMQRRLRALERAAVGADHLLCIVMAAGRAPAAVEQAVAELEWRQSAAGRRGPPVIVIDR